MQILMGFQIFDRSKGEEIVLQLVVPCTDVKCSIGHHVGDRVEWVYLEPESYVFENFKSLYDILYCGIEAVYDSQKGKVFVRVVSEKRYCLRSF